MRILLQKILLLVTLFIIPDNVLASPSIVWDNTPTVNDQSVTGYLNISGITPSQPMVVLVFSDSNDDFNPYTSYAFLGPAQNGPVSFVGALDQNISYFLPVMVDETSFNGQFNPYEDQGQFQTISFGQVATLSNNGAGGGGQQTGDDGQVGGAGNDANGQGNNTGDGPLSVDTEGWPQNAIPNTLAVSDLNSFVVGLLNALLKIGIPIMTIFLVYSGLRLVMARGNEKELEDAKKNLLWVIIGVAVLLGAWTIVKVLKGTFDELDLAYVINLINFV
jgi:hypothetical protein